ncbi:MAG TPA: cell envelope integrity protein CreD, partial [Balneolaceae bacterium]|nr:cell envelope integrity protein CreD [Balneolaceae bacterium]
LTLVLLIPSLLIQNLIRERENRRDSVAQEISQKWGKEQVIIGPVLSIPYTHHYTTEGKTEQTTRYAHFLPDQLEIDGNLSPEVRYRGLYKAIVYNSELSISGSFPSLDLENLNVPAEDLMTEDAFVSVGISDMTGIKDFITINWNGNELLANPGVSSDDVMASGISISPDIETNSEYKFDFYLNLNGSSGLQFAPVGKQTNVTLTSEWTDPSFTGTFLPA